MNEPTSLHTQPHTPEASATGGFAPTDSAAMLVRVLDDYLAELQAGRDPDRAQLLAAHPDLAAQLEQRLHQIEHKIHPIRGIVLNAHANEKPE